MAVKIRLTRMGRKNRPFYRIVVMDSRTPRDGRFLENIGTYNPIVHPVAVTMHEDRVNYWLDQGAVPSVTVKNILQHQGVMYKRFLAKQGYDDARIHEEMQKWELMQSERERRKAEKAEQKKKIETEKAKKDEETEKISEVVPEAEPLKSEVAGEVVTEAEESASADDSKETEQIPDIKIKKETIVEKKAQKGEDKNDVKEGEKDQEEKETE